MKKVFVLIRHDLSVGSHPSVLNYYSTHEKALCVLQWKASVFGVGVYHTDGHYSTECIEHCGESFFYCIREIDVL